MNQKLKSNIAFFKTTTGVSAHGILVLLMKLTVYIKLNSIIFVTTLNPVPALIIPPGSDAPKESDIIWKDNDILYIWNE